MRSYDNDSALINILDDLQNQFNCHTAILYGSRARGDHSSASDYDLIGLRNEEPKISYVCKKGDAYVDAYIYTETYTQENLKEFLRIRGGKVLFQRGNLGTKLLAQVEALYRKGAPKLTDEAANIKRVWIEKTLQRSFRGDLEGHFRLHWLLNDLLESYFELRNLWYRGPKESFSWLELNDSETHHLFENALKPNASERDIRKLCLRVIEPSVEASPSLRTL